MDPASPGRRRTRFLIVAAALLGAVALGAFLYLMRGQDPAQATTSSGSSAPAPKGKVGKGGFDTGRPTPVVAEVAKKGDINLYLNGLGTILPLRTVTVRARVDGELIKLHFTEGQMVKAGDLLAEIDPRPFEVMLMQAQGQMVKDQALLANSRIDLERYQTLFQQDSIAKQQVDTQVALVRQYEGQIRTDQSAIDNARLQITYSRITAPISGRLGLRLVDQGNVVHASDANGIVVITQLEPVAAVFTVPQDNLPAVMRTLKAGGAVGVEAWDRENKVRLTTGTLITVDNQIDPTTGTVKLKAEFANQDGSLFSNQFVNVRMLVETRRDQTVVPTAAVQRGSQGMYVYVVNDDNTVSVRQVKLGPTDGPLVEIDGGVQPGERVVVDGVDRLREGAKVDLAQRPSLDAPAPGAEKKGRRTKGPG